MPTTNPTRTGYKFLGWYTKNGTDGDWGEKYLEGAVINNDTTVYAKWIATDKDCLANVTLTALSGTAGANDTEGYDKLVDGKKILGDLTKWCVTSFKSAEVILKASAYTIPVGYTLTTGNDNDSCTGRNPKDWVLYGSNDYDENKKTGTWTAIDTVTNDIALKDENYRSYDFDITNTKAYKYFKFEIKSIQNGDVMQLGEFELKGESCEHTFGEPEKTKPTCTIPGKTEYRCLNCDVPVINTIKATGHTLGENGTCSVCGESCGAKVGDTYYTSIQEAVDAALASDTDNTVTLLQNYDIAETLTIGSGQVTLDLNGHTITMTNSGSVIKLTDSNSNFILDDSSAERTGTITNSSTDTEYGGGIYIYDGKMTMNGCTIKACTAKYGGGIYKSSGELVIANGTITECKATGDSRSRGGGIFNYSGKLEIAGGTISKCSADGWYSGDTQYAGGGGIFNYRGNIVMSGGTITECTASGGINSTGGGIKSYSLSAVVEMSGGTISGNTGYNGGGIMFDNATGTISNAFIKGNNSTNLGGGIHACNNSNVTIENTQITENTTYGGGGVSIHEDVVDLYLYNGNISGNTATVEGGGIYCQSNQIKIKGGIQITGNKLISGTTQIENNVYLRNDTTMQVDNPSSEIVSDDGVTVKYAQIGVTVEDGYSNVVAANDTDYSEYFTADSENERVYYDDADKMLKIVGIYTVAFDIGNGEYYNIVEIERNTAVSEPKGPPSRAGYYFGAWYNGDTPYDFTQPVSSDLTLTAKWLEAGTFGMNITPSKIYIVADNAKAYGAAYKGGKLTDITMQDIVDYAVIELNTIDLDMMNADTISLLIWDENQAPLCRNIIFNIGG